MVAYRKEYEVSINAKSAQYHLYIAALSLILIVSVSRGRPHLSKIKTGDNSCRNPDRLVGRLMAQEALYLLPGMLFG